MPNHHDDGTRRAPAQPTARLAMANGLVLNGRAFGATGRGIVSVAEVVFNTAMTGYQEAMTDPSYTGQILTLTAPLVGNTGVNEEDVESAGVTIAGLVVRELARRHSNFRATRDLSAYLADAGVLGIERVDTRAITRQLRTGGAMAGALTDDPAVPDAELVRLAREAPSMAGQNLVTAVGCAAEAAWGESLGAWSPAGQGDGPGPRVLALDCGAKRNILRHLTSRGCRVTVVPHDITAGEVIRRFESGEADGLFVSNGPGDPAAVERVVAMLRELLSPSAPPVPIFGICLGHQLLALASGARTFKLKFGHRGANQPVRNDTTGRIEITSQNHGFAVDPESLDPQIAEATHVHLNDGTLAGFRRLDRPVFAVQYHPEASPGPHDSGYLFDAFVSSCSEARFGASR
ncbi:MAG: glutamine-hydrolyzing carbamoyl-phosphate synthase small subunit [Phycisphaerales bacterium]